MTEKSLYERLGGYDGITGFVNNLLPSLNISSAS
jgi:hemoglobin